MMRERRKDDRAKVDLQASWEGALSQLRGSIVDLSTSGCFILSDDKVRIGELIRVIIQPPRQGELCIWGEVVYQISAKIRPDAPVGKWYSDVWIKTNNPAIPKLRVPLAIEIEVALSVSPTNVQMGQIKAGTESDRTA